VQFPRPQPLPEKTIRCYHCGHASTLSAAARSTTCPACYRGLVLDDLVIGGRHLCAKVHTCGRVVVGPRGCLIGTVIHAQAGLEVSGRLVGSVVTSGPVVIRRGADWEGDLSAPSVTIERGAHVRGRFATGVLVVPDARPAKAPAHASAGA
jgi:hypothetical protein